MVDEQQRRAAIGSLARIAPLEDEEMLKAVQRGLAEVVIPELQRLGADQFVVSQTRSLMSIVGFVSRGLYQRQGARNVTYSEIEALGPPYPPSGEDGERLLDALKLRLVADIEGRLKAEP